MEWVCGEYGGWPTVVSGRFRKNSVLSYAAWKLPRELLACRGNSIRKHDSQQPTRRVDPELSTGTEPILSGSHSPPTDLDGFHPGGRKRL
jgi:hypothetical protein